MKKKADNIHQSAGDKNPKIYYDAILMEKLYADISVRFQ